MFTFRYIDASGKVSSYTAFDGAPFSSENSGGLVTFMDLSVPNYGLDSYDWILSLEVAEHIPKPFEDAFMDNIVRHARKVN